jgi:hypothetical protein
VADGRAPGGVDAGGASAENVEGGVIAGGADACTRGADDACTGGADELGGTSCIQSELV